VACHAIPRRSAAERGAHRGDHGAVVGGAEDRAAGDEGVAAGVGGGADVVDLDAAVDLEPDVRPLASMRSRTSRDLLSADGMKLWPPKPG
jgi:hypothetical protein